jgi:hypothetical protein
MKEQKCENKGSIWTYCSIVRIKSVREHNDKTKGPIYYNSKKRKNIKDHKCELEDQEYLTLLP